jgi:rhomboid protease GluP
MGWVIGLIVFGVLVSGINNWAHGGGILSGILLAFLLGYNDQKQETAWHKLLAYACILVTAGVLIWAIVHSLISVIAPGVTI